MDDYSYIREYMQKNCTHFGFTLNKNTDADVVEYLSMLKNKRGYMLELIRADMAKRLRKGEITVSAAPHRKPREAWEGREEAEGTKKTAYNKDNAWGWKTKKAAAGKKTAKKDSAKKDSVKKETSKKATTAKKAATPKKATTAKKTTAKKATTKKK